MAASNDTESMLPLTSGADPEAGGAAVPTRSRLRKATLAAATILALAALASTSPAVASTLPHSTKGGGVVGLASTCADKEDADVLDAMAELSCSIADASVIGMCGQLAGFCDDATYGEKVQSVCCGTCSLPCEDTDANIMKEVKFDEIGKDLKTCSEVKKLKLCGKVTTSCCKTCSSYCPCEGGSGGSCLGPLITEP